MNRHVELTGRYLHGDIIILFFLNFYIDLERYLDGDIIILFFKRDLDEDNNIFFFKTYISTFQKDIII